MVEYKKKWNNYKVGDIKWINLNRNHYCRKKFVEYIEENNVKNILEVGGGELIEFSILTSKYDDIKYSVVDISEVFLKLAEDTKGLDAYKGDMIDMPFRDKQFDLIYGSSILEHSPNISKTIKEMSRVSHRFYFNMFCWNMKEGNLESIFRKKKKFYSTDFNIDMLFNLINKYGTIEKTMVYGRDGGEEDFQNYRSNNLDITKNRNGKYLAISGIWNR